MAGARAVGRGGTVGRKRDGSPVGRKDEMRSLQLRDMEELGSVGEVV